MSPPRRSYRWWLFLFLLLAAVGTAAILARSNGALKVSTVRLRTGPVEELISATSAGTVEADRTAVVAAEISGRIRSIHIRQGPAKAHTAIFELDDTDLRTERRLTEVGIETSKLRREQARLQREKLEADLARWRGTDTPLERLEQLDKEIAIARKDEEIADARLRELDASLALVDLRLGKTRVTAPADGTVARLHAEEGEFVTTGRALFTFISGDIFLRAPIDEVDMGRLPDKAEARVHFDAYPNRSFEADVVEVMPVASADEKNNRTVDVKVRVRRLPPNVLPGMSARVEIVAGRVAQSRYLPTNVIHDNHDNGTRYVYLVEGEFARRRQIKTGRWNWDVTEVLDGLAEGDEIIETGKLSRDVALADGMKVVR
ncbi:MAG: efflux RND transporter periplasmic adaptor subunit [Planctomycetes bacterium]|nr:efflux RND transporter periplasmic adaptor subunit [Planctomycetota bacterium]